MPRATSLLEERTVYDMLVYGASGTAKTTFGARSPMPFIILTEAHGIKAIADVNPHAYVVLVDSWIKFLSLHNAIKRGQKVKLKDGQDAWRFRIPGESSEAKEMFGDDANVVVTCQTSVVDSLSDLQELHIEHLTSKGTVAMDQRRWGELYTKGKQVLRDYRRLPVNVVIMALEKSIQVNEDLVKRVPLLQGQIRDRIEQWYSVIGWTTKAHIDGETRYIVWFDRSAKTHCTKKPPQWPKFVAQDIVTDGAGTLGSIISAINPDKKSAASNPEDDPSLVSLITVEVATIGQRGESNAPDPVRRSKPAAPADSSGGSVKAEKAEAPEATIKATKKSTPPARKVRQPKG